MTKTITNLQEFLTAYKPNDQYEILARQSSETKRYLGAVFKKTLINKYSREYCPAALLVISEVDFEKFISQLKPYVDERA